MDLIKAREQLSKGSTIYDLKLRVAYYARVSTESDNQLNSLTNQKNYFEDLIKSVDSWNLIEGYIDEGISGTSINNREAFRKMIIDGKKGRYDLLLTKEVSRFARNTVDSIYYTQILLRSGIIVNFISDNINTIYPDSEFRLTLMASLAQDEVRKLSERVKFGMKRSIKDGRLLGGGNIIGYNKSNGKLIVDEKQSPIIEMIFDLYSTNEYGLRHISDKLKEAGYLSSTGKKYSEVTLKRIIRNPRYKGYYSANLSSIEDYKTHKKIKLPKEEWIVYKDDNIPAITTEEKWDKSNKILDGRSVKLNKRIYKKERKYTSKIICKEHNTTFIRCATGKRKNNPVWQCNEYLRNGLKGCQTPIIKEQSLDKIFGEIISSFLKTHENIKKQMLEDYTIIIKKIKGQYDVESIQNKIAKTEEKKEKLLELNLEKMISNEEFENKNSALNKELLKIKNNLLPKKEDANIIELQKDKIRKGLTAEFDKKENFLHLIELLIDKVEVSKINGNRKNLNLEIGYKLNKENTTINLNKVFKNP